MSKLEAAAEAFEDNDTENFHSSDYAFKAGALWLLEEMDSWPLQYHGNQKWVWFRDQYLEDVFGSEIFEIKKVKK